jgi:hypothetical protein
MGKINPWRLPSKDKKQAIDKFTGKSLIPIIEKFFRKVLDLEIGEIKYEETKPWGNNWDNKIIFRAKIKSPGVAVFVSSRYSLSIGFPVQFLRVSTSEHGPMMAMFPVKGVSIHPKDIEDMRGMPECEFYIIVLESHVPRLIKEVS